MTALLVVCGAALGAPLRYRTDRVVQIRHDSSVRPSTKAGAVAGEIVPHSERLHITSRPEQTLFIYSVVPGSDSEAALRRLAGTTTPASAA
ncbi:hypothetical protein [Actinomadura geliboluensis]|uniref:hypothetical protein n=1 Tax=Actinomadura geliboluensis TaxID=882440 RepID=UPI003673C030